jgi:hypothetical protein
MEMGDNSEDFGGMEDFGGTDPLCFLMDNNQATSEASLDSTTCGRSSHWAFQNECSNNSFLSSSVTLKPHKNESISVYDDNFDIDNVAPDSIVMGEHDSRWLNSLSELQRETIIDLPYPIKALAMKMKKMLWRKTATMLMKRSLVREHQRQKLNVCLSASYEQILGKTTHRRKMVKKAVQTTILRKSTAILCWLGLDNDQATYSTLPRWQI